MNILKELQKAWDNAITTQSEKEAASAKTVEELKKEIESETASLPQRTELPETAKYEQMERSKVTDEELSSRAEKMLAGYESSSLKNIEDSAAQKQSSLEKQKADAETAKREKLGAIEEAYKEAKQNVENDALKRGMARSSVAVARTADLESGKADSRVATENEYAAAIKQLADLLDEIESGKTEAIGRLKAEMQSKIAEKVESLRDKALQSDREALKYNNSLAEKEAKDKADRITAQENLYSTALSNALKEKELTDSAEARANRYASNYNKMDALFSEMNRSDAAKLIKQDPFFRANLSEYLYYKLYDKYCN